VDRGGLERDGGAVGSALTLAAGLHRTGDPIDSPRVSGPRDRIQRRIATEAHQILRGPLSRVFFAGERHSRYRSVQLPDSGRVIALPAAVSTIGTNAAGIRGAGSATMGYPVMAGQ
jgi:hypothetical protein